MVRNGLPSFRGAANIATDFCIFGAPGTDQLTGDIEAAVDWLRIRQVRFSDQSSEKRTR